MTGMPNFRVVVTDTNSRFTASSVTTGNLNQLTGVGTNCETARVLRFDLPNVPIVWIYLGSYAPSSAQTGKACNIILSLTSNNNADSANLLRTEIRFLTSNGTATRLAEDGSTFMGAAKIIGSDLQVRIRQNTTSDYRFYYFSPALPGSGLCTIDCTGGVFTYSGTSTTAPTDKYIQPTPRNDNFFVAGRCIGTTGATFCDYGDVPFTATRGSTGFNTVTFAAAHPRGSSYVAMCQGGLLSQVTFRTSTSLTITTMDQTANVMDANFDFFVLN